MPTAAEAPLARENDRPAAANTGTAFLRRFRCEAFLAAAYGCLKYPTGPDRPKVFPSISLREMKARHGMTDRLPTKAAQRSVTPLLTLHQAPTIAPFGSHEATVDILSFPLIVAIKSRVARVRRERERVRARLI
jgi:hypothetical protein